MPISESPRFLETAARTSKPRRDGITHVIDKGTPLAAINELLEAHGPLIDVWKFGFGTAYVDGTVGAKVELLRSHEVRACPGGTLLEAAWWQGRSEEFFEWAGHVGFDCVEVSRGATGLPASSKRDLIAVARDHGFEVFAEVGSKDPDEPALPSEWLEEARSDSDCGARWLVAEGRESGTVGLYAADGSVRADLVEALARLDGAPVVYEAPLRQQQAWLVNHLGANVNLANIAPAEVLGVEALRHGLRSDTLRTSLPSRAPDAIPDPEPLRGRAGRHASPAHSGEAVGSVDLIRAARERSERERETPSPDMTGLHRPAPVPDAVPGASEPVPGAGLPRFGR